MADLYGSQDVTVRNDDGTKIVDVDTTAANSKGLNVLGTGVAAEFYPIGVADLTIGQTNTNRIDTGGNMITRSSCLTDEGSYYEPFKGNALSADWSTMIDTGATITVANSTCVLNAGTTANSQCCIHRVTDFPPLIFTFMLKISQRIANQDIYFGYGDHPTNPVLDTMFARFHFTGTDIIKVCCESQSSADTGGNEGLNTQILMPVGASTAGYILYRIENDSKNIRFFVGTTTDNMILVSTHTAQIPDPYTVMYQRVRFVNGATPPASATTVTVDTITCANINIVDTSILKGGTIGITQTVVASAVNSTISNLASNAVFTGSSESTLGVAGIQVNFKADQQCTLQIQQSMDGTNWDINDTWVVPAATGSARTFQATAAWFRMIVTNNGLSTTTYLRLQIALCPIIEALPRALSVTGRLKVEAVNVVVGSSNTLSWAGNNAPYKANMWLQVLNWAVPLNYTFNPYQIQYSAGNSSSYARATKRLLMGTFNNSTQVFTDGGLYTAPDFGSYLDLVFTADVGTSRTLTITYVNQDGVGSRTATYSMTSGAGGDKTGNMQRIVLQAGDTGIRDITNVTTNGTGTATLEFYGETDIFTDSADESGVVYTGTLPLSAFIIPYGFTVSLQITSASTAAVDRVVNLYGLISLTTI